MSKTKELELIDIDKELLIKTLEVQSHYKDESRMVAYIEEFCKTNKLKYEKDEIGNIYITKGKAKLYPCVVAHQDTIHKIHKEFKVFEHDDQLFAYSSSNMSQVGIGADDKCGIFIGLQALLDCQNIKVVFFTQEEIGCIGSKKANMEFFKDCTVVLQADRKGNANYITNAAGVELCSKEFIKHLEPIADKYQYKAYDKGGVTDVMALKEKGLDICALNCECYWNPHSDQEIVVVGDMIYCYNFFRAIIDKCSDKRWLHTYKEPETVKYKGSPRDMDEFNRPFRGFGHGLGYGGEYDGEESWNKLSSGNKKSSKKSKEGYSNVASHTPSLFEDNTEDMLEAVEDLDTAVADLALAIDTYMTAKEQLKLLEGSL